MNTNQIKAWLQITLTVDNVNRSAAASVYSQYKAEFLSTIKGALSKDLLIRDEDVQVLHGFDSVENAREYLQSDLFSKDVVEALKPHLGAVPEIRIYRLA